MTGDRRGAMLSLLDTKGAGAIAHPGGTLLAHLVRTEQALARWGSREPLQLAGLSHAVYGTDGFDVALVGFEDRSLIVELIGEEAERIVYLYASCDRGVMEAELAAARPPRFRDRIVGEVVSPTDSDVHEFMELTFANELDLVAHTQGFDGDRAAEWATMFRRYEQLVTPAAFGEFERLFASGVSKGIPRPRLGVRLVQSRAARTPLGRAVAAPVRRARQKRKRR